MRLNGRVGHDTPAVSGPFSGSFISVTLVKAKKIGTPLHLSCCLTVERFNLCRFDSFVSHLCSRGGRGRCRDGILKVESLDENMNHPARLHTDTRTYAEGERAPVRHSVTLFIIPMIAVIYTQLRRTHHDANSEHIEVPEGTKETGSCVCIYV